MKLKKTFSFKSDKFIWRMLFSEFNKLIIEERDPVKREVFFNCLDAENGKPMFKNFQLEEKFWIGIETTYKDIIVFHKYGKPDMPGHKSIIIFDTESQKILWQTEDFTFMFMYNDKMYAFKNEFENKSYYAIDYRSGEIKEDIGKDVDYINSIRMNKYNPNDFFNFLFPEVYNNKETSDMSSLDSILNKYSGNRTIIGNIEYIINKNLLFFNFYERNKKSSLANKFFAVNLDTEEKILELILNENSNAYVPDSFFFKDNILYLLKNKNEIVTYSLK